MTVNAIKLAQFYTLTFSGAKAVLDKATWDKVPGANKLRKFFLGNDKWQDDIVRISVSDTGAKGGVFFLEVDTLDRVDLDFDIGNLDSSEKIWNQLVEDELITEQGIKTAKGRKGVLPKVPVYQGEAGKTVVSLLKTPNPQPQFVVKGTDEPARILFAEYVLSRVGKAKIPKSLVLEVTPQAPTSTSSSSSTSNSTSSSSSSSSSSSTSAEGMIMLNILKAALTDSSKRNPKVDVARYAECYKYLEHTQGTNTSYIGYLVVQKLIKGDKLPLAAKIMEGFEGFLIDQKLRISPKAFLLDKQPVVPSLTAKTIYATLQATGVIVGDVGSGLVAPDYKNLLDEMAARDKNPHEIAEILKYRAAVETVLGTVRGIMDQYLPAGFRKTTVAEQVDILYAALPDTGGGTFAKAFADYCKKQAKSARAIQNIVGSKEKMYNLGRILFADLALKNADRLETMNEGNFFFVDKLASKPGKVSYPIGCIDNDSFLFTYKRFKTTDEYVDAILKRGTPELSPVDPPPADFNPAPSAAINKMMNLDKWFDSPFCTRMLNSDLPKCIAKTLGEKYCAESDYEELLDDSYLTSSRNYSYDYDESRQQQGWQDALAWLKHGFCEALVDYKKIGPAEFRQVYNTTIKQYQQRPSVNFDFMAFEVCYQYFARVQVDQSKPSQWTFTLPNYNAAKNEIIAYVDKTKVGGTTSPLIASALKDKSAAKVLQKAKVTAEQIETLLAMVPISAQEALVPCPRGYYVGKHGKWVSFGALPESARQQEIEAWVQLSPASKTRVNAAICAILAQLVNDYESKRGDHEVDPYELSFVSITDSWAYKLALLAAEEFCKAQLGKEKVSDDVAKLRQRLLTQFDLADYA